MSVENAELEGDGELELEAVGVERFSVECLSVAVVIFNSRCHKTVDAIDDIGSHIVAIAVLRVIDNGMVCKPVGEVAIDEITCHF